MRPSKQPLMNQLGLGVRPLARRLAFLRARPLAQSARFRVAAWNPLELKDLLHLWQRRRGCRRSTAPGSSWRPEQWPRRKEGIHGAGLSRDLEQELPLSNGTYIISGAATPLLQTRVQLRAAAPPTSSYEAASPLTSVCTHTYNASVDYNPTRYSETSRNKHHVNDQRT